MFSLRKFRRVLEDINVTKVSEATLLDVCRYFRAETSRHRGCRRDHRDRFNFRNESRRCGDDSASVSNDGHDVMISYAPLVDAIFDRQKIRSSATQHKGGSAHHQPTTEGEKNPRNTLLGKMKTGDGERFTDGSDAEEEGLGEDEIYVDVRRILEARTAALDVPDSLGRRPLFVAAAVGAVSAAKTFARLGAASILAVEGKGLTAHGVAPSPLMRRILPVEARRSLDEKLAQKNGYLRGITARGLEESVSTDSPLEAVKTQGEEAKARQERRRGRRTPGCTANTEGVLCDENSMRQMEGWISTLADGELASSSTTSKILEVDHKTSLRLAASAGPPRMVQSLLDRGLGAVSETGEAKRSERSTWTTLSPKSPDFYRGTLLNGSTHRFCDHVSSRRADFPRRTASRKADTSGWSPLHACCGEVSSLAHFRCAANLLGSEWDPTQHRENAPAYFGLRRRRSWE